MKDFFSSDNKADLIVGLLAVICLIFGSNLFVSFMPGTASMILVGIAAALFSLFAVLMWRENPRDEREAQAIMSADRLGFIAGAIALSICVVIQTIRWESSGLLIIVLIVMILAKLAGKYLQK